MNTARAWPRPAAGLQVVEAALLPVFHQDPAAMCHLYPARRSSYDAIPTLAPVSAAVRGFNEDLLTLLTKPEPLTAAEWAWVELVAAAED